MVRDHYRYIYCLWWEYMLFVCYDEAYLIFFGTLPCPLPLKLFLNEGIRQDKSLFLKVISKHLCPMISAAKPVTHDNVVVGLVVECKTLEMFENIFEHFQDLASPSLFECAKVGALT